MPRLDPELVIVYPMMSEKTVKLIESENKITFIVRNEASKFDVWRAVEVEIAMLSQIDDRRAVRNRREFDPKRRGLDQAVDASRGESAGKTGVAVRRFEDQLDG